MVVVAGLEGNVAVLDKTNAVVALLEVWVHWN